MRIPAVHTCWLTTHADICMYYVYLYGYVWIALDLLSRYVFDFRKLFGSVCFHCTLLITAIWNNIQKTTLHTHPHMHLNGTHTKKKKTHPHAYTENNYNSSYGVYVLSSLFAIFLSFSHYVYIDLIVC